MNSQIRKTHVVISLMKRDAFVLGGQEIRWGRIIKMLHDSGCHNLEILCTESIWLSWKKYGLDLQDVPIRRFSDKGNKYYVWITAQFFVLRYIRWGSIMHIPALGWLSAPAAVFAKMFMRCKLITSITSCKIKPLKLVSKSEYYVSVWLSKFADIVDVLNPSIDFDGIIDKEKISIAPGSFSDPIAYRPGERKSQKVVFAGHLQQNKGIEILERIVEVWPANEEAELIICGPTCISTEASHHAVRIQQLSKGKNVTLREPKGMAHVLKDAKVFLSLQLWDNYPSQSLLEAMLSGCFIVATGVGDTNLLVKSDWGRTIGLHDSTEEYMRAIKYFLDKSDEETNMIGDMARNFVIENHNIERYGQYLQQLWDENS